VVAISPADLGDATVTAVSTPALSWDARTLFLGVVRPRADLGDIYVSRREKLTGKQKPFAEIHPLIATRKNHIADTSGASADEFRALGGRCWPTPGPMKSLAIESPFTP
jgi:hypothetical protein